MVVEAMAMMPSGCPCGMRGEAERVAVLGWLVAVTQKSHPRCLSLGRGDGYGCAVVAVTVDCCRSGYRRGAAVRCMNR